MQLLYSAFSLPRLAQRAFILLPLADLLHPSPAKLPGEYTSAYTLQGATGNLSIIEGLHVVKEPGYVMKYY